MFGTEPWATADTEEFGLVVWIILVIAAVAGVVRRLRSGQ
jgi:hypothetical protein